MTNSPPPAISRWPLFLAALLLVAVIIVFAVELLTSTTMAATPEATIELADTTYMDIVTELLNDANPQNGGKLVEQYACAACHRLGAANKIAPPFVGIADRAATRRPPLTAAAYIYESIINPTAYIVEGFNPAMPQNLRERLSDQELGDIIAYLLTPDAK